MAIIQVPVVKAKGKFIEVDTDKINPDVWAYLVMLGAKSLVNRGTTGKDAKDLSEEGYVELANKQAEAMYSGKTRIIGAKATKKREGVEHTEAVRIAKDTVKQMIKANGEKISHYSASEITKAAKAIVDADPDTYLAAARENLARAASAVSAKPKANVLEFMSKSDAKIKAAEKKAEEAKKEKAATSAGKVPPAKPPTTPQRPARH